MGQMQPALEVESPTAMQVATAPRRERRRPRVVPALPVAFLVLVVLAAIFAPALTDFDPNRHDLSATMQPPSWLTDAQDEHVLGTDRYGRDTLTRLLYGARTSMLVVVISLFIAVVLGGGLGILAGYAGGWIDAGISRVVDVMLAMPSILVAIAVAVALGPSFRNVVLILGFLSWPNIARLVRGEALALRQNEFVRYSRTIGVPRWVLLVRHVFPNVLPTLMVTATLEVANIIMAEASLSFLGAGVPPPQASWGSMIDEGRALIATGWWLALFPGLAIVGTVLSFNTFGDWLRDRLDPTTRRMLQ
jgi:ABC-type dipeptide/oligopeptide/nickel transport system permease subunit